MAYYTRPNNVIDGETIYAKHHNNQNLNTEAGFLAVQADTDEVKVTLVDQVDACDAAQLASETARDESVVAKDASELAQVASETAQGLAETAQANAETAQGLAEDAVDEAQAWAAVAGNTAEATNDIFNGTMQVWTPASPIEISGTASEGPIFDGFLGHSGNQTGLLRVTQRVNDTMGYYVEVYIAETNDGMTYTMPEHEARRYIGGQVVFGMDVMAYPGYTFTARLNIDDYQEPTGHFHGTHTQAIPDDGQWHRVYLVSDVISELVNDLKFSFGTATNYASFYMKHVFAHSGSVLKEVRMRSLREEQHWVV